MEIIIRRRKALFRTVLFLAVFLHLYKVTNAIYSANYNLQLTHRLNVPDDCDTESVDDCNSCTRQCGGGRVFHVLRCSNGSTRVMNHVFPHSPICSAFCYNGGACDTSIPVVWNNDSYCCYGNCYPNNYPTHYGYCCELRKLEQ